MNFYAASALVNSGIMTLLFFILLLKKNKPRAAKFFNVMNVFAIIWAVSYYLWQTADSYNAALFWVKMLMVGAILAAPALLHFSTAVTGKERDFAEIIIGAYFLATIFLFLDFFSPNFIAGLQTKMGIPFFPTAGKYYAFYLLQWAAILCLSFFAMYKRSKEVEGEEKEFMEVLLVSTIISFVAGSVNYFLWYNIPVPPVATLITGMYAVAGTILLLQGKFYKVNLFYFEFFAGVTVLASLLQFVLSRQLPSEYVSAIIIFIILLATVFLVRNSKNEQLSLEKIKLLNKKLSESLTNMINSIDGAVIIINSKDDVEIANNIALNFFCLNPVDCPKKFFDFIQGNSNQTLVEALANYRKNGAAFTSLTVLSPELKNLNVFFSQFSLKNDNDATLIIMKDHFEQGKIGKK